MPRSRDPGAEYDTSPTHRLCGNSGGGSLKAFYQAEAEGIALTTTPPTTRSTGAPIRFLLVDGMAMPAAHRGRAATIVEWIDPSVID
jgi:hypothetical protein